MTSSPPTPTSGQDLTKDSPEMPPLQVFNDEPCPIEKERSWAGNRGIREVCSQPGHELSVQWGLFRPPPQESSVPSPCSPYEWGFYCWKPLLWHKKCLPWPFPLVMERTVIKEVCQATCGLLRVGQAGCRWLSFQALCLWSEDNSHPAPAGSKTLTRHHLIKGVCSPAREGRSPWLLLLLLPKGFPREAASAKLPELRTVFGDLGQQGCPRPKV